MLDIDVYLNSERISSLLQCRFKRNSNRTSFNFKSFLFEQSLNNVKISHSSLKINPKVIQSVENSSSESSDDEIEQMSLTNSPRNIVDDDYLDKLAQWQPDQFSTPPIESDEDEDEEEKIEDNIHVELVELLTGRFTKKKLKNIFI